MIGDYRILLYLFFGGAMIVGGVFLFPPIVSRDGSGPAGIDQAKFDAAFGKEMAFCEQQPNDINCQCFAKLSGTILVEEEPRLRGAVYIDKQQLARGQAADSC